MVAMLVVDCFGCAKIVNMQMRIPPAGVLESEDYQQLERAANEFPARVGEQLGTSCVPTMAYYVSDNYDFSREKYIYIPDFEFLDQRADQKVTKDTADQLATLLSKTRLFERADRTNPVDADIELRVVITKYQDITSGQTAKVMLTGGAQCGFFLMEAKLIDRKGNDKIGAIQVNHITVRTGPSMGGIMAWSGSRRPEGQIPQFLLNVFERVKAGQTRGTSSIAFDCTKDDGTNLIDRMCQ
jgi:hypothetical protein